jgi:[acyl-carrier-protein] S-malonyltransferase
VVRRITPAPVFMAGHSLGEYAALICAGGLPLEEGLRLIRRRGELMGAAFPPGIGAMAAVIGLDAAAVDAACREAGGTAQVANYNSPVQTVISGLAGDVGRAGEIASRMGAKRVIPLAVSGPFHTRLMEPTAELFAGLLDAAPIRDLDVPVVFNVDAKPRREAREVRAALKRQMAAGVRWEETMLFMRGAGVTGAVEVGPRNVLAGLMKRTVPEIATRVTDQPADIESLADSFAKGE